MTKHLNAKASRSISISRGAQRGVGWAVVPSRQTGLRSFGEQPVYRPLGGCAGARPLVPMVLETQRYAMELT
ncbi:hypothetical protein, partial [Nocardia sp. SC052]|uniref:hypothetical protein n=1 Tax=Nocardia sichangensis TaxID=3385975 RepID=UPI00399F4B2A